MTPVNNNQFATFTLNKPQAKFLTVMANISWLPMSRASGKTVGCSGPWVIHKVEAMPRSSGGMIGRSFADLKSKILKPLFSSFQMLGLKKNIDYVYNCPPPETWDEPYIPIIEYKNVISFPNGTTIQLISLHEEGSANSNSFQWLFGPEAKYFNQAQLESEVIPTLRGNYTYFKDNPWYMSQLWETDKYHTDIHWILKKKELHNEELAQAVIYYQLEVNRLRQKLLVVADSTADKIRAKIARYTTILNKMRRNMVYYGEANAYDNIANVGQQYLDNLKKSMTDYAYRISVLNEDPTRVEHGWYQDRTDRHTYDVLHDDDITKPLIVASDYQASISPLVVCQFNDLVEPGVRTLNFIKAMYVKFPLGLRHMVEKFCKHYEYRLCKEVIYIYDHTAIGARNTHKPYNEEVEGYFKDNGWKVTSMYMGQAPLHEDKHQQINKLFREDEIDCEPIRISSLKCTDMLMSMDLSEIKAGTMAEKDKGTEKKWKDGFPQENSTHFGDVFDQLIWALLEMRMYSDVNTGFSLSGFSR